MGNTGTPVSVVQQLSKRFIKSNHPLDPEGASLYFLHERLSQEKFILKVLNTNDAVEHNKMEELICKKLANSKFIRESRCLTPTHQYQFEEQEGYCNISTKAYILLDITGTETLNHFMARNSFKNSDQVLLDQEIIYKGLLNLVKGVALLKYYHHQHEGINCDTVFYCEKEKTLMLGDPWIVTHHQQKYYSPQKLQEMQNQIDKQDPYIGNLFSIGMIGLKALGVKSLNQLYNWHKKTLNLAGLHKLISEVKSLNLRGLLIKLLGTPASRQHVLRQIKVPDKDDSRSIMPLKISGQASMAKKKKEKNPMVDFLHYHPLAKKQNQIAFGLPRNSQPEINIDLLERKANKNYEFISEKKEQAISQIKNFQPLSSIVPLQKQNFFSQKNPIKRCRPFLAKVKRDAQQRENSGKNVDNNVKMVGDNSAITRDGQKSLHNTNTPLTPQLDSTVRNKLIFDEVNTPEKRHQEDVMEGFEIRQIASEGEIITEEEGIETKIESIILYQGSVQEELKQKQFEVTKENNLQNYCIDIDEAQEITFTEEGNFFNAPIIEQSDEESCEEIPRESTVLVEQIYENNSKYVGQIWKGYRHGEGTYYYPDDRSFYDGHWRKNQMHGFGKLYYEKGRPAYEGNWSRDEFHGEGTLYQDQPNLIEGSYDYSNMNQTFEDESWHIFSGEFQSNKKMKGRLILSNGQWYEGSFKDERAHGQGKFRKKDGLIVEGFWKEGFFTTKL